MVKIKGANAQDKKEIAAARAANKADASAKKAAPRSQTLKRGDQAPEAKATKAEQSKAAEKLFGDADQDARSGLPLGITREQHENHVRRAVGLGF